MLDELYPRGVIRNAAAASQIVDFSGLRWGTITPTDLDTSVHRVRCSVDMAGRMFAWVEFKYQGVDPTLGQWKHLGYLISNSRAPALVIIAEHDRPVDQPIMAASARVRCYMETPGMAAGCAWVTVDESVTVFRCLDDFFRRWGSK